MNHRKNIEKIDTLVSENIICFSKHKKISGITPLCHLNAYTLKDKVFYFKDNQNMNNFITDEINWLT